MAITEKTTWKSFREVITEFFGNKKDPGYMKIVQNEILIACQIAIAKIKQYLGILNNIKIGQYNIMPLRKKSKEFWFTL